MGHKSNNFLRIVSQMLLFLLLFDILLEIDQLLGLSFLELYFNQGCRIVEIWNDLIPPPLP
jgi:hypothetical protein